jgi:transcriptional regulator with XRE-family HTH domain
MRYNAQYILRYEVMGLPVRSFRVENALKKLGSDIRDARRRRKISSASMAERIGVSRATVTQIEKGNPAVGMGSYALAIYVLDGIEDLEMLMDRTNDPLGLDLMDMQLPRRVRRSKKP